MAAIDQVDPRIKAVAAVCAPLNPAGIADFLDAPKRRLYLGAARAARPGAPGDSLALEIVISGKRPVENGPAAYDPNATRFFL